MPPEYYKKATCEACGKEITLYDPATVFYACKCAATYAVLNNGSLQRAHNPMEPHKADTFLKPGMRGRLEGREYTVLARLHCHEKYFEFDTEDGRYVPDDWYYEEYVLKSAEGYYLYIVYDDEGYWLNTPADFGLLRYPEIDSLPATMHLKEREMMIAEHGNIYIESFEGELDYHEKIGPAAARFASSSNGNEELVAELTHDGEIECFVEKEISLQELCEAFEGNPEADKRLKSFDFRNFAGWVLFLAGAVCVLLFLVATYAMKPETILSKRYVAKELATGVVTPSWQVKDDHSIYTVTLATDLPAPGSVPVTVHILNEKENVVNDMYADFESYYEDANHYEVYNFSSERFSAAVPGMYRARLYTPDWIQIQDRPVTIQVKKGGMIAGYYQLAAAVFFLISIFTIYDRRLPEVGLVAVVLMFFL